MLVEVPLAALPVARLAAQVKKVLVLADDDPGVVESPRPQSPFVEQVEPTLEDVFGVMSGPV